MLKRMGFVLGMCSLALMIGLAGQPLPPAEAQAMIVQLDPQEIQQGRTALLRVATGNDINRVEVVYDGTQFPLYRSVDGDWVGLLPANITAERGPKTVSILSWNGDEAYPPRNEALNIVWGGFLYQDIGIPNALLGLLDPELNRNEEETLLAAYNRFTPLKYWRGQLQKPVPGAEISEFGGIRNYNDGMLEGRHTGVDYRAGTGEPAMAAGDGRVLFADFTPIRGNHVIIDHGMGLVTGYSHLSEIYVVPGQWVMVGDVIGAVGATGRVQGAHMHFEITVHGAWVDPPQFLSLTIPEALDNVAEVG